MTDINSLEKRTYSICVEECSGRCCKPLYEGDNMRIPVTSKDLQRGLSNYRQWIVENSGRAVMTYNRNGCTAKDPKTNLCRVYDVRPTFCRLYPFQPCFLRVPITGEHDVWRDNRFGMNHTKMPSIEDSLITVEQLLKWYDSDNNLIFPMILLSRCGYSENMSRQEMLNGMRSAVDLLRLEKDLWKYSLTLSQEKAYVVERAKIFTPEEIREKKETGEILCTAVIWETVDKFLGNEKD